MVTIRVPDITRVLEEREDSSSPLGAFGLREYEVTEKQAKVWQGLNEKERLTLVLRAEREHGEISDYL